MPSRLVSSTYRAIQLGVVAVVLAFCQSCQNAPADSYLASHYDELVNLTVPVDASNVTHQGVKRTLWSETGSWEFHSKMKGPQYAEWVTEKLKGDFKTIRSSSDALVFARNLRGDTESITVRVNSDHEDLHVRVELSVVPD